MKQILIGNTQERMAYTQIYRHAKHGITWNFPKGQRNEISNERHGFSFKDTN